MSTGLRWLPDIRALVADGRRFDPSTLSWRADDTDHAGAADVSATAALRHLAATQALRRVPIGIIGPREATQHQCALAEELGFAMAQHGLQLLCGGKNGVMEAACKGHAAGGGLPIGLLPDEEWQAANPYVAIPIATGIGPARNAIIARSCLVLVAVGGGVGTLSEMALGLQFKRLVLALADAPVVDGVARLDSPEAALARIAGHILGNL
ncbi:MAG: TIGR00725 family protein [Stutzerimonas stutzeri]|uniref:TIGR00725 family protein n=1 Tax=Bosea eneae TaxID=151454 RepID=A0ABW0IKM7_9HYPH|nr:MAG: TIGR00725 family protein [Stutzerimonas stutzeri]